MLQSHRRVSATNSNVPTAPAGATRRVSPRKHDPSHAESKLIVIRRRPGFASLSELHSHILSSIKAEKSMQRLRIMPPLKAFAACIAVSPILVSQTGCLPLVAGASMGGNIMAARALSGGPADSAERIDIAMNRQSMEETLGRAKDLEPDVFPISMTIQDGKFQCLWQRYRSVYESNAAKMSEQRALDSTIRDAAKHAREGGCNWADRNLGLNVDS